MRSTVFAAEMLQDCLNLIPINKSFSICNQIELGILKNFPMAQRSKKLQKEKDRFVFDRVIEVRAGLP
jgi:hypothetical protein